MELVTVAVMPLLAEGALPAVCVLLFRLPRLLTASSCLLLACLAVGLYLALTGYCWALLGFY